MASLLIYTIHTPHAGDDPAFAGRAQPARERGWPEQVRSAVPPPHLHVNAHLIHGLLEIHVYNIHMNSGRVFRAMGARMSRVYFPAIIEGGRLGYGVFFPDLDGLASGGDTVQQAALNAEEGLRAHLELMAEEGLEIPQPSELDAIKRDPDVKEVARILVGAEAPTHRVLRLNVTLPEDLVRRIDAAATNRSRFLAEAAETVLRRHRAAAPVRNRRKQRRSKSRRNAKRRLVQGPYSSSS